MMALLRKVADPGNGEGARWAGMRIHRVTNDIMTELGASSKLNAEWEFFYHAARRGARARAEPFSTRTRTDLGTALDARSRRSARRSLTRWGLLGILVALGLLIWLAYRGWSVLLLAPAAALLAAASSPASRCLRTGRRPSWAARRNSSRSSSRSSCSARCSAS